MFDIGFSELLLIAIVSLIAIGPKDMPKLLFRFGRLMRQIRMFLNGFRDQYAQVMHEIEVDHYRKEFGSQIKNEVETDQMVKLEKKNDSTDT
jgi:sec-independent protein translocase protein TatB